MTDLKPTMYGNIPVYGRFTATATAQGDYEGHEVFSVGYPLAGEFPKPNCLLWKDEAGNQWYTFTMEIDFVENYAAEYTS